MNIQKLRQVDILEKTKPYCQKYNVKMNKSDISQYVSGLVEPGQEKLSILGMALNVDEVWLMGYNVPMDRESKTADESFSKAKQPLLTKAEQSHLHKYRSIDDKGKHTVDTVLEMEYNRCNKPHLLPNAAHAIEGASEEDIKHDDDLMNDDSIWD